MCSHQFFQVVKIKILKESTNDGHIQCWDNVNNKINEVLRGYSQKYTINTHTFALIQTTD